MNKNKPASIKIINGLLIFRLCLAILIVVVFYFIKDLDSSERTFWPGVKEGIIKAIDADSSDPNYIFGYLLGRLFIPTVLAILLFVLIKRQKYIGVLVTSILDLLFGLSQGLPIISTIIFICILTSPTKSYLKRTEEAQNT